MICSTSTYLELQNADESELNNLLEIISILIQVVKLQLFMRFLKNKFNKKKFQFITDIYSFMKYSIRVAKTFKKKLVIY